jgi:p-aminobenzoyl-glutamate transporter AbgT
VKCISLKARTDLLGVVMQILEEYLKYIYIVFCGTKFKELYSYIVVGVTAKILLTDAVECVPLRATIDVLAYSDVCLKTMIRVLV